MIWRVLVSAPYMMPMPERYRLQLSAAGVELIFATVNERLEERDLAPIIHDVDGAICGDDRFTENVLRAAPRLKIISKWGTGVDSIDQAAAEKLGIRVART